MSALGNLLNAMNVRRYVPSSLKVFFDPGEDESAKREKNGGTKLARVTSKASLRRAPSEANLPSCFTDDCPVSKSQGLIARAVRMDLAENVPVFRRVINQGRHPWVHPRQANSTKKYNGIPYLPYLQPLVKRGQEKKISKAFSSVLAFTFARVLTTKLDSGIYTNKCIQTDIEAATHTDSGIDSPENSNDSAKYVDHFLLEQTEKENCENINNAHRLKILKGAIPNYYDLEVQYDNVVQMIRHSDKAKEFFEYKLRMHGFEQIAEDHEHAFRALNDGAKRGSAECRLILEDIFEQYKSGWYGSLVQGFSTAGPEIIGNAAFKEKGLKEAIARGRKVDAKEILFEEKLSNISSNPKF